DDGVLWSAQADFLARLADWEQDSAPVWPLQRAEGSALLALNVPRCFMRGDGQGIGATAGIVSGTAQSSWLERARARVRSLDEQDIAWQIEVIRQNASVVSRSAGMTSLGAEPRQLLRPDAVTTPTQEIFLAEADKVAEEVSRHAIRRGAGAAW